MADIIETKHTPGTWERKDRDWLGERHRQVFGGGRHIATVHTAFGVWDTNEANANLIAAAPDLLDIVKRYRKDALTKDCYCGTCVAADAAIAKARLRRIGAEG